ncbi:hypothetical protein [Streptomyces sp. NPDC058861]|uniref:hypothetical protein n=1 Tax=Streptomyces sp. NPDC058861 TaxID=3346653 RepID=UPI0036A30724
MTAPAATARPVPDLTNLGIELRHRHRLAGPEQGLQEWHIRILDAEREVGSLHAARCHHYGAGNLAERMSDHGGLCALAAVSLLTPDGEPTPDLEEAVEYPGNFLLLDQIDIQAPFDDQAIVTAVIAEVIDRLTDHHYAVVLPCVKPDADTGTRLLAQAGVELAAEPFDDDLQLIDTCLADPEHATARARLASRIQHPHWHRDEEDEEVWPDEEEDVLTPRTTAVLRQAAEELSTLAWQEVTALGDEPLPRRAGGVFGQLPPITLRRNGQWRRQMARTFDDLATGLRDEGRAGVEPRCTAEEMALHLIIGQARSITTNRPNALAQLVDGLPSSGADYDWDGCLTHLFEDHDVLMLFDAQLDGMEDPDSEVHQTMGMVNLAADEWFEPFSPDHARDPDRGFRL